ncbi:unnamed protein product, partial [Iphiclides podalirius]
MILGGHLLESFAGDCISARIGSGPPVASAMPDLPPSKQTFAALINGHANGRYRQPPGRVPRRRRRPVKRPSKFKREIDSDAIWKSLRSDTLTRPDRLFSRAPTQNQRRGFVTPPAFN